MPFHWNCQENTPSLAQTHRLTVFPMALRLSTAGEKTTLLEKWFAIKSIKTSSGPSTLTSNLFYHSPRWYFKHFSLYSNFGPPTQLTNIPCHTWQMILLLFHRAKQKSSHGCPSTSQHKTFKCPWIHTYAFLLFSNQRRKVFPSYESPFSTQVLLIPTLSFSQEMDDFRFPHFLSIGSWCHSSQRAQTSKPVSPAPGLSFPALPELWKNYSILALPPLMYPKTQLFTKIPLKMF